jgi:cation diffusion facilitator family transporter
MQGAGREAPDGMNDSKQIVGLGVVTMLVNLALMLVKIITGVVGHSYALVADGIESASDIVVSLITWTGFYLSLRPPDREHPFGHGRIESLAGIFSGAALLVAAGMIATMSVIEIRTPHHRPAWFTLPVLILVVVAKEWLSRRILREADDRDSRALEGDAWHHRSDALTSGAAAIGIGIALVGGDRYAAADDWAALFACVIIVVNGCRIIGRALHENLDGRVDSAVIASIRGLGGAVPGVLGIEKCVARKSGSLYFAELHVEVDPEITVAHGHLIGHDVKDHLLSAMPQLADVVIHLEPHTETGDTP